MHITPDIGILASINDDAYLLNAFDTNKNDYKNKLVHDLGVSIGVHFQIKGWKEIIVLNIARYYRRKPKMI